MDARLIYGWRPNAWVLSEEIAINGAKEVEIEPCN